MKPVSQLVASWDKPKELWEALKTDPQVRKKLWSAKSRSGTTLSQMLIERTKAQCVEANSSTYELSGPAYDFYTYSFYQEKHGEPKPEALCKLPGEDEVYVKVYATSMMFRASARSRPSMAEPNSSSKHGHGSHRILSPQIGQELPREGTHSFHAN